MEDSQEKLPEEMLRDAEITAEPGTIGKDPIVHKGDEEIPAPMVAKLKSAGYVFIYDTKTGEQSLTNRNMLPTQLKKKRADGSLVFTTVKPKKTPKRGTHKCLLHADDPNRSHYDELGLPVCKKDNLMSPFQVRRHMEKRHKMEWAAIQQEKQDIKEEEERKLRKALLKSSGKKK